MSYIDRLNALKAQKQLGRGPTQPTLPPAGEQVSVVSGGYEGTLTTPGEALATWRACLAHLQEDKPCHGLGGQRWRQLLDDADWLFEQFAAVAATDGWPAPDLFGVLPGHDGWGGIVDRLRGSRSLVMTTDIARWRRCYTGTPDSFARGASIMPRLVLLWDVAASSPGKRSDG